MSQLHIGNVFDVNPSNLKANKITIQTRKEKYKASPWIGLSIYPETIPNCWNYNLRPISSEPFHRNDQNHWRKIANKRNRYPRVHDTPGPSACCRVPYCTKFRTKARFCWNHGWFPYNWRFYLDAAMNVVLRVRFNNKKPSIGSWQIKLSWIIVVLSL